MKELALLETSAGVSMAELAPAACGVGMFQLCNIVKIVVWVGTYQ